MFRRWVMVLGVSCLLFSGSPSEATANIYQWAYVNPSNPGRGVYQSTTL